MATTEEVCFEIYVRQRAKAAWTLNDVMAKREEAIAAAASLASTAAGSRVVKQVFDSKSADYFSLVIFEAGDSTFTLNPDAEDLPAGNICREPRDFYSREARLVIARLLGEYLTRQRLTPIELLHRADALKVFETTTGVFQHAVQRLAVVRSAGSDADVQSIIKDINATVIAALHRVYRDAAAGVFPTAAQGGIGELAARLQGRPDGDYLFNAALASYLKPAATWDGKLVRLLSALKEVPSEGLGADCVDMVIEEIINSSGAMNELIGGRDNLNSNLTFLLDIFSGTAKTSEERQPGLYALIQCFAQDQLSRARGAVIRRIVAELKSAKRLAPASSVDELRALMRLTARLAKIPPGFLDPEDLISMLVLRSRILVTTTALNDLASRAMTPDEKIQKLLDLEANILGVQNKRALAAYIFPIISSSGFESHFLAARPTALAALKRLADYQARVQRSGFASQSREDMSAIFDRIAVQVEQRNGVIKALESKSNDRVERALALFNLCQGGIPQGRAMTKVHKTLQSYIQAPGFSAAFAARLARMPGGAGKDAESELQQLMQKAGMNPRMRAA